jgi:hypothetical protein
MRVVAAASSANGHYSTGDSGTISKINLGDPVVLWDHSQEEHQTSHSKLNPYARRIDVTGKMQTPVESLMNEFARPQTHGHGNDTHGVSFDTFKVVKVFRIENDKVWQQYATTRSVVKADTALNPAPKTAKFRSHKDMCEKLDQMGKNEHYLFHGTKDEIKHLVIDQGFDHRVGGGMLGSGIYFAESASKSDQYVPPTTNSNPTPNARGMPSGKPQWMFLARSVRVSSSRQY